MQYIHESMSFENMQRSKNIFAYAVGGVVLIGYAKF